MALSTRDLPPRLRHLNGYLTTREAAAHLNMSYWHFMHLVEAARIPGIRVVDRWLFSPADLETYRRSTKSGEVTALARTALASRQIALTTRQRAICEALSTGTRPAEIARQQAQSRQAVHAQIAQIREKLLHLLPPTHRPILPAPLAAMPLME